jgi:hypothetical protein
MISMKQMHTSTNRLICSWLSFVPPGKRRGSSSTRPRFCLSNSLFISHPTKKSGQLSRYSDELRVGRPGLWFPAEARFFSPPQRPDRLWGTPSLLSNWYWGFFSWEEGQGREADHSPPSSADVKNGRVIPPLLHTSSWHGALINQAQGQFLPYHHTTWRYIVWLPGASYKNAKGSPPV